MAREIGAFVKSRPTFAEVCIGPGLNKTLRISENVSSFSIGSLGNIQNIEFGIRLINAIGIKTDDRFRRQASDQGKEFNEIILNVFAGFSLSELNLASTGGSAVVNEYRDLVGLYVGGLLYPIMRINWSYVHKNSCEFLAPNYQRGIKRNEFDPIDIDFLKLCITKRSDDERLYRYIRMYNRNTQLNDELLRIAAMFSLLEYMASPIAAHFARKPNSAKVGSRTIIRFMRGYFETLDIPKFTLYKNGNPIDFEFDHIELAGKVRDSLFHGGTMPTEADLGPRLKHARKLLAESPDMIASALRKDCEHEILLWANRSSRVWDILSGRSYDLPPKDPEYSGRELMRPYFSGSIPNVGIQSAYIQVKGSDVAFLRLGLPNYE
ncbi:MAG TPA: hypothetical protein VGN96_15860 [Roseococcus sp.]|nr:hypothetical protein [Roseococcus sp.]